MWLFNVSLTSYQIQDISCLNKEQYEKQDHNLWMLRRKSTRVQKKVEESRESGHTYSKRKLTSNYIKFLTLDNSQTVYKFMLQIIIRKWLSSRDKIYMGQRASNKKHCLCYQRGDDNYRIIYNQLSSPIHSEAQTRNQACIRIGATHHPWGDKSINRSGRTWELSEV